MNRVALGLDFGSSRVKATVLDARGRHVVSHGLGWTEAGCSRRHAADWLAMLSAILRGLLTGRSNLINEIASIGVSAVSPCIAVVNPDDLESSSPLVQYDEEFPLDIPGGCDQRTRALAEVLASLASMRPGSHATLLSANGWLVWQLTGRAAIDHCSIAEMGLIDSTGNTLSPLLPIRQLGPTEVVGALTSEAARFLGLPHGVTVVAGGSDSLALVVAARLPAGAQLVYLGTFFSVMQATADFSGSIPSAFTTVPYTWQISFPGGAIIERLAAAKYSRAQGRQKQIESFLKSAELGLENDSADLRVARRSWKIGEPTLSVPLLVPTGSTYSETEIALAPIRTFASAVADFFANSATREIRVAGGLSRCKWLCRYIEDVADIRLIHTPPIEDAEGAALFALASMSRGELSSTS